MNGRKEHEIKTNQRIEGILKDSPFYLRGFYEIMTKKSHTTKINYIRKVLCFLNYIKLRGFDINDVNIFKNIRPSMISAYIYSLDIEDAGKAANFYAIKSFFKYLKTDMFIENNPMDNLEAPKITKPRSVVYLTKEEIEIVKNNIINGVGSKRAKAYQEHWKNRDMALMMFALDTGLRITAILEINVGDIDFVSKTVKVIDKGNMYRKISFGDQIRDILYKWKLDRDQLVDASTDAFFISNMLKRLDIVSAYRLVKKYTYNIDKKITPHKLRSTCGTITYNKTKDVFFTAKKLGHKNIRNTQIYIELDEEKQKELANVMTDVLF